MGYVSSINSSNRTVDKLATKIQRSACKGFGGKNPKKKTITGQDANRLQNGPSFLKVLVFLSC